MAYSKNVERMIEEIKRKKQKALSNSNSKKQTISNDDSKKVLNQTQDINKKNIDTKTNDDDNKNINTNSKTEEKNLLNNNNNKDDSFITVNDYEIINMDSNFYQNANYLILDDFKKIQLVNYILIKENCSPTKACKNLGTNLNNFKKIMEKNNYEKYEKTPTNPMKDILKANNIKPAKIYRIAKIDSNEDYLNHLYSLTKDGFNNDLYFAINKKGKSSNKINKIDSTIKKISSTTKATTSQKSSNLAINSDLLSVLTQIASLKDDLKEIVDYKKDIISLVKKGNKTEDNILKDISKNKSMDIRQRITNKDFIDFSKNTLNSLKFIYKDCNSIKIKIFISHLASNLYIANYDLSYDRISNLFSELGSYMDFVFEDGRDNNDFIPIKNYDGNVFNKVFIKLRGE